MSPDLILVASEVVFAHDDEDAADFAFLAFGKAFRPLGRYVTAFDNQVSSVVDCMLDDFTYKRPHPVAHLIIASCSRAPQLSLHEGFLQRIKGNAFVAVLLYKPAGDQSLTHM